MSWLDSFSESQSGTELPLSDIDSTDFKETPESKPRHDNRLGIEIDRPRILKLKLGRKKMKELDQITMPPPPHKPLDGLHEVAGSGHRKTASDAAKDTQLLDLNHVVGLKRQHGALLTSEGVNPETTPSNSELGAAERNPFYQGDTDNELGEEDSDGDPPHDRERSNTSTYSAASPIPSEHVERQQSKSNLENLSQPITATTVQSMPDYSQVPLPSGLLRHNAITRSCIPISHWNSFRRYQQAEQNVAAGLPLQDHSRETQLLFLTKQWVNWAREARNKDKNGNDILVTVREFGKNLKDLTKDQLKLEQLREKNASRAQKEAEEAAEKARKKQEKDAERIAREEELDKIRVQKKEKSERKRAEKTEKTKTNTSKKAQEVAGATEETPLEIPDDSDEGNRESEDLPGPRHEAESQNLKPWITRKRQAVGLTEPLDCDQVVNAFQDSLEDSVAHSKQSSTKQNLGSPKRQVKSISGAKAGADGENDADNNPAQQQSYNSEANQRPSTTLKGRIHKPVAPLGKRSSPEDVLLSPPKKKALTQSMWSKDDDYQRSLSPTNGEEDQVDRSGFRATTKRLSNFQPLQQSDPQGPSTAYSFASAQHDNGINGFNEDTTSSQQLDPVRYQSPSTGIQQHFAPPSSSSSSLTDLSLPPYESLSVSDPTGYQNASAILSGTQINDTNNNDSDRAGISEDAARTENYWASFDPSLTAMNGDI
ncbi:MAG: hypothetical protein Q9227_007518 [Pyrenula ochraceoflavens]